MSILDLTDDTADYHVTKGLKLKFLGFLTLDFEARFVQLTNLPSPYSNSPMSWEWRVFWQVTKENDSILDQLNTLKLPYRPSEKRLDTYVECTKYVGIKWRRGSQLEIKIRTERDEIYGVEKWTKVLIVHSPIPCDVSKSEEIKDFIISQLDKLITQGSFKIQLEEAKTSILAKPTIHLLELFKERSHTYTSNCCIEQVKLTCPLVPAVIYKSISVEGSKDNIVELLTSPLNNGNTIYQHLCDQGYICSYPEFVLTQLMQ